MIGIDNHIRRRCRQNWHVENFGHCADVTGFQQLLG